MSECEYQSRLDAFFDGELEPPDSERIEQHVETCAACSAALREMRQVGRMFDSLADEPMSDAALSRIHRAVDQADVEADAPLSLWRVSLVLTSLAASVVVIGSVWLREVPSAPGGSAGTYSRTSVPSWERVATLQETGPISQPLWETSDRTRLADTRLTQFMIENLTPKASHEKQ